MNPPDPPRLRDGEDDLARLLRQAHDDLPTPEQMARIAAQLAPPSPEPPGAASPRAPRPWLKLVGGGLLAAGAALLARPAATPSTPAAHASAAASEAPAPREPASAPAAAPSAAPEAPRPGPSAPRRAVAAPSAPAPDPPAASASEPPATPADPLLEFRLLEQARQQLEARPAESLRLAREHLERYPGSKLATERELLTAEALWRTGQRAEAQARARRLLDTPGGSVYRERLRPLLAPP